MGAAGRPQFGWERRHASAAHEVFAFDFWLPDGTLAGFACLTLHPRGAWYWAGLVGDGRPYLLVLELDLAVPRGPRALDIRGEALWADLVCEVAFDQWSIGLEAFGVAFDDPDEAVRSARGDRTGLGFDLGWQADASTFDGGEGAYVQTGLVDGEILVGSSGAVERIAFDGLGSRRHLWGDAALASPPPVTGAVRHRAPIKVGPQPFERQLIDRSGIYEWVDMGPPD